MAEAGDIEADVARAVATAWPDPDDAAALWELIARLLPQLSDKQRIAFETYRNTLDRKEAMAAANYGPSMDPSHIFPAVSTTYYELISGEAGERSAFQKLVLAFDQVRVIEMRDAEGEAATQRVQKFGVTRSWITSQLVEVVKAGMHVNIELDKDGKVVAKELANAPAALRGLHLLGLDIGMFQERPQVVADAETDTLGVAELIKADQELSSRISELTKTLEKQTGTGSEFATQPDPDSEDHDA